MKRLALLILADTGSAIVLIILLSALSARGAQANDIAFVSLDYPGAILTTPTDINNRNEIGESG